VQRHANHLHCKFRDIMWCTLCSYWFFACAHGQARARSSHIGTVQVVFSTDQHKYRPACSSSAWVLQAACCAFGGLLRPLCFPCVLCDASLARMTGMHTPSRSMTPCLECMYWGSRRASCRPPYGTAKCAIKTGLAVCMFYTASGCMEVSPQRLMSVS
jgi:hypothetical protein